MGTLLFPTIGPPALHQRNEEKKKNQKTKTSDSLTATISCGSSFLALSLLPPSATCSQSLYFPSPELGMERKEQGGPGFGMFLILCAPRSFLGSGLLCSDTAPSGAVLKGCHGGNEQRVPPGEAISMPPLSPREPFPAQRVQLLCLPMVRLSAGVTSPCLVWRRCSFSRIGTPFDGQLYLLWNERGTEQRSPCLLPLHAVSLEAWSWPAGLSTRLSLGGLYHTGALSCWLALPLTVT